MFWFITINSEWSSISKDTLPRIFFIFMTVTGMDIFRYSFYWNAQPLDICTLHIQRLSRIYIRIYQGCNWKMQPHAIWNSLTRSSCFNCNLKGTVQRKLTGVQSDINRKVFLSHWTADISFLNFKGSCSLISKKLVSAAKAKICGLSDSTGRPLQITDYGKSIQIHSW